MEIPLGVVTPPLTLTLSLHARIQQPGEWQVTALFWLSPVRFYPISQNGIIIWPRPIDAASLLGWSTPARAWWADFDTLWWRAFDLGQRMCRAAAPCAVRLPADPLRTLLGVPPEAEGQPLWPRRTFTLEGQLWTCLIGTLERCQTDAWERLHPSTPWAPPTPESEREPQRGFPQLTLSGRVAYEARAFRSIDREQKNTIRRPVAHARVTLEYTLCPHPPFRSRCWPARIEGHTDAAGAYTLTLIYN